MPSPVFLEKLFWLLIVISLGAGFSGCSPLHSRDKIEIALSDASAKREGFVFAPLPEALQEYGYDNFTKSAKNFFSAPLPYEDYVGKTGYFLSADPVHEDRYGHLFWPVILETGEEFFYVYDPKRQEKYAGGIISQKKHEEIATYQPKPLVPGSEISVESFLYMDGKDLIYLLSNGQCVSEEFLINVRKIASLYPAMERDIAETLLGFTITRDEIEDLAVIRPKLKTDLHRDSEIRFYIRVRNGSHSLRMTLQYYGLEWRFLSSYKIVADSYRWSSPELIFKREYSRINAWEWIDEAPSQEDLQNAIHIGKAEKAIIRFQGNLYHWDFTVPKDQQIAIIKVLDLYNMLGRSK